LVEADEMDAIITPCRSLDEVVWLGFNANLRHGKPLKKGHLEAAFVAYVKAGRNKDGRALRSYRSIAKDLASVSHCTVRRWMKRHFPTVFREMGEDGGNAPGGIVGPKVETLLVREALALLCDAAAVMEGVAGPGRRRRVAVKARELARMIDPEGEKTADLSAYLSDF
jgi:hypothetical protein